MKPLKIGNLTIDPPLILAPMAGYTDTVFRSICLRFHCGMVYTELVSAEGLIRGASRTGIYLDTAPEERPIAAHIYGTDSDIMAWAAELIESLGRFDLIDINCGCPVRKIAGKGAGVALMRDPDKIYAIVRAVSQSVDLPVTIKTRIGISPGLCNISEVAQAVEEAGGSAIAIHARLATARHSGPADLDTLAKVKRERNIPVIGNGGVAGPEQALQMIEKTGVDGLMIGKGAIGNPWIFGGIQSVFDGVPYVPPSNEQRLGVIAEHIRGLHQMMIVRGQVQKKPSENVQKVTSHAFRGHLGRYLRGVPGINRLQHDLMHIDGVEDVIRNVADILQVDVKKQDALIVP